MKNVLILTLGAILLTSSAQACDGGSCVVPPQTREETEMILARELSERREKDISVEEDCDYLINLAAEAMYDEAQYSLGEDRFDLVLKDQVEVYLEVARDLRAKYPVEPDPMSWFDEFVGEYKEMKRKHEVLKKYRKEWQ